MVTSSSDQLTWLYTPPIQRVRLPVETAAQVLPFEELSWEDFEKLCLRLVGMEANVEHHQPYGTRVRIKVVSTSTPGEGTVRSTRCINASVSGSSDPRR
jgi:hypothetical protein